MSAQHTLSEFALQLDSILDELKGMKLPDGERIAVVRTRIDAAFEQQSITVREWRELVEKCSHIRRVPRG